MPPITTDLITFSQREDGIHDIRVQRGTRDSVYAMFDYFMQQQQAAPPGSTLRYLIRDTGSTNLPLNHIMNRTRQDFRQWPHPARVVYLSKDRMLHDVFARLMSTLPGLNIKSRFMSPGDEAAAVAWLLAD